MLSSTPKKSNTQGFLIFLTTWLIRQVAEGGGSLVEHEGLVAGSPLGGALQQVPGVKEEPRPSREHSHA